MKSFVYTRYDIQCVNYIPSNMSRCGIANGMSISMNMICDGNYDIKYGSLILYTHKQKNKDMRFCTIIVTI